MSTRNLILVLGDQLDSRSPAFDGFDVEQDAVWMAEVDEEATHVWSHKLRLVMFFSAMRHFRDELLARGFTVAYHELSRSPADDRGRSFSEVLSGDVRRLKPTRLIVVEPGDDRVRTSLLDLAADLGIEMDVRADRHFYCSLDEFREFANGRKRLLLEHFYRRMRKTHGVLVDAAGQPEGGTWNLDTENRESFGREGPQHLPRQRRFRPDRVTREVIDLVEARFPQNPGETDASTIAVTRRQARQLLAHFVEHLLPEFGRWEDAMWTDEPFLLHSRLSAPLNLKLLNPRECITSAVEAYRCGRAPLNSVEGFVRQILGWREFVRGIYWLNMPKYRSLNHLQHTSPVPQCFWDGQTEMNCVRQSMQHVLRYGYSHHIHRLMVLGNFSLLWGVDPHAFHEWHMGMYVDAIDWVSLPNTLGMSQYGDGGIVGTKPYCSSGNYINKMSNFCSGCRFDYRKRSGSDACPFTTLYWEFLDRHSDRFRENQRMSFAMKNLDKVRHDETQIQAIRNRAAELRKSCP